MKKLSMFVLAGAIAMAFTVPAFAQSSTSTYSTTTTSPAVPEKSDDVKVEKKK